MSVRVTFWRSKRSTFRRSKQSTFQRSKRTPDQFEQWYASYFNSYFPMLINHSVQLMMAFKCLTSSNPASRWHPSWLSWPSWPLSCLPWASPAPNHYEAEHKSLAEMIRQGLLAQLVVQGFPSFPGPFNINGPRFSSGRPIFRVPQGPCGGLQQPFGCQCDGQHEVAWGPAGRGDGRMRPNVVWIETAPTIPKWWTPQNRTGIPPKNGILAFLGAW